MWSTVRMASSSTPAPAVALVHTSADETLTGRGRRPRRPARRFLLARGRRRHRLPRRGRPPHRRRTAAGVDGRGGHPARVRRPDRRHLAAGARDGRDPHHRRDPLARPEPRPPRRGRPHRPYRGGAAGFRQALIRSLTGVLEVWFTLGRDRGGRRHVHPRAQRLGDLLAGTASERTRTRRLPAPAPGLPPGWESWAAIADVSRLPDRLAVRVAQFVRGADALEPAARVRVAASLAQAVRPSSRRCPRPTGGARSRGVGGAPGPRVPRAAARERAGSDPHRESLSRRKPHAASGFPATRA